MINVNKPNDNINSSNNTSGNSQSINQRTNINDQDGDTAENEFEPDQWYYVNYNFKNSNANGDAI